MEAKDGSAGFDYAGSYTKVVPNELIEYSFGGRICVVEFVVGTNSVTVVSVSMPKLSTRWNNSVGLAGHLE